MAEMPPFNGNGTPGRLLTCQVPRPPEKLKKRDGICDELLNRLRQENEREHGWFYRTFIQGHGRPVGSGETPEINSALIFQRECRALPNEVDKSILDDMRQRAQSGLPPEQSVKLKNDLNILQRVYQPGEHPDLALSPAEQAWVNEKNLYATNTLGMALLGPFGIPGCLTRMGGGSESQVAAANDAGAMVFDLTAAHVGIKGGQGVVEPTPLSTKPRMVQEPPAKLNERASGSVPPGDGAVVQKAEPVMMNPRNLASRQGPNEMSGSKVKKYTSAMKKQGGYGSFPPVEAAQAGDGKPVIIDGHHRAEAAIKAGVREIPVHMNPVSPEDASLLRSQADAARAERMNRW